MKKVFSSIDKVLGTTKGYKSSKKKITTNKIKYKDKKKLV